ncbi:MAG: tetratricopeptide repeat protein [Woeseia sp.]
MLVRGYIEVDDATFISRAESSCGRALSLNPNLDVVHTALGDLYRSTGRHADAEASYQKALAIDPSSVEALTGLGDTYSLLKQPVEAEASLRKAIDAHPGDASAYNNLGTFLYRSGRYAEAAEQFEYVVGFEPRNMNGYSNLASAYLLTGDFSAAAPVYEKAISIEPTKGTYSNLALMHYYLGDLDAAIDNLTQAIHLQPNDYLAHSTLGDALWVAGRQTDARQEFRTAEKLALAAQVVNPNDPLMMMDLAWIQAMLDKQNEARKLIDKAVAMAPDDPYTHFYDALIHLRGGDKKRALAALKIAVDRGYSRKMMAAEPHLTALRDDPEFRSVIDRD